MIKLTKKQLNELEEFYKHYVSASNPASGSKLDANANVVNKNVATLEAELAKDFKLQFNRKMIADRVKKMFGELYGIRYIDDIEEHFIYVHDETSLAPYCVSISMYPFLLNGMKELGGESGAPKHLTSFCGNFINLVFAIASQFAGAVATVEFLMCFDYFARKDYGKDYLFTNYYEVMQQLQGVVYALNQPAAARGYQSVFWNISTFDKEFFYGIFNDFVFPDGTKPNWETLDKLQREFHQWFREERKKALLTFPVVTHAAIVDENDWVDKESKEFIAKEYSLGGEFFIYTSDTADSLASCCRVRNEIQDNDFSYSLGAGGVMTGSKNVITLNLAKLAELEGEAFIEALKGIIGDVHKYQLAFNEHFKDMQKHGLLPVYDAGFISLDKQYLTLGINGLWEAKEILGEDDGFFARVLSIFKEKNKEAYEEYGVRFNTEMVPAENLGVKNAKWFKEEWGWAPRDCFNSYFYAVEDDTLTDLDKLLAHGRGTVQYLDGGSALHMNRDHRLTFDGYCKVLELLAKTGCNYYCENIKKTLCDDCGYIHIETVDECPKCGSKNIGYATRVIGYLKRVDNFSKERQNEESKRYYHR
jgi:ribonucleoside-triphosphate reductase